MLEYYGGGGGVPSILAVHVILFLFMHTFQKVIYTCTCIYILSPPHSNSIVPHTTLGNYQNARSWSCPALHWQWRPMALG